MRTSRIGTLVLLAVAVGGCRSSGRISVQEERPGVDPLKEYVGQRFVLRHFGDRKDVAVKPGDDRKATCDAAVQVAAATAVEGGIRFLLNSLGRARVGDATVGRCQRLASPITLTVKGVNPTRVDEWRTFVASILQTPEAYLAAQGKTYQFAPEPEPKVAARAGVVGEDEEKRLGRRVTAWPKPLFSIEPAVSSGGKVQHQGEVEFHVVVGADGRTFRPVVTTPLSEEHTKHITSVLHLWRFQPAREGDKAVPAYYDGRTVFYIY
jgi:hypothetical protein